MTLLSIAKGMAVNIGEAEPGTAQDGTPFSRLARQFINETGKELVRRVDWHKLNKTLALTGDGTDKAYDFETDHDRLAKGQCVTCDGAPVRGSLSQDEWNALTHSAGTPRYFYALGTSIKFYPYPKDSLSISVAYQSNQWAKDKDGDGISSMMSDTDVELLPTELLLRGAVWRWYRHAGRDFSDQMAEYEGMLTDYAKAEGGFRSP